MITYSELLTHLLVVGTTIFSIIVVLLVLRQRHRTPQAAIAWLLLVALVPYLALPAFLLLGFRKRRPLGFIAPDVHAAMLPVTNSSLEGLLCGFHLPAASADNELVLLTDGDSAWRALHNLVDSARHSIDVTLYLLANDAVGRAFVEQLTQAATRGIRVRVLLDSYGGLRRPRAALKRLLAAGGEVRSALPIIQLPSKGHVNLRNHRKMIIVDGQRAFAGGMNIAKEYLGPEPGIQRWRDLAYRVEGSVMKEFNAIFASDWRGAGGDREVLPTVSAGSGAAILQLVPSGPDVHDDPLYDTIVYSCHLATRRIWMVTPYFLPSTSLTQALLLAIRRKVDVRIIVPEHSNQRIADFARGSFLHELADAGARVQTYPSMLHAKAILVDDNGMVGSANMDIRSLFLNHETMLFIYSHADIRVLEEWFQATLAETQDWVRDERVLHAFAEKLFRLSAPLL